MMNSAYQHSASSQLRLNNANVETRKVSVSVEIGSSSADHTILLTAGNEEFEKSVGSKPTFHPAADAMDLNALRKELEMYKTHTQVLMQTKSVLEHKLRKVTMEFEEFKDTNPNPACASCNDGANPMDAMSAQSSRKSSIGESAEVFEAKFSGPRSSIDSHPQEIALRASWNGFPSSNSSSQSALHSAVENLTFSFTKEFKNPIGQPKKRSTSATGSRLSFDVGIAPHPRGPMMFRAESSDAVRSWPELDVATGVSKVPCRHFIKGRCRYKKLCKFSHEIAVCPYCSIQLPTAKIAASTHLSRCYKAQRASNPAIGSNDSDDESED